MSNEAVLNAKSIAKPGILWCAVRCYESVGLA